MTSKSSAKPKVLVADKIADEGIELLKKKCDVTVQTGLPEADLIKIIPKFEGMMVRAATKVTAKIIAAGKNLKIVGRAGVGVDNIDVAAATEAGIFVINSPEGNIVSAAEHTIALMMSLARNIPQAHQSMHDRKWEKSKFVGGQFLDKTLGIVGFGKIGRLVGERAVGLGMKVLVADPFTPVAAVERIGGTLVDKDTVFKESDFITFHVPKSPETYHMCSTEEFKIMKKGVRIINVSRGGVVDEPALIQALKSGKVAGAALDVFETEPLGESELLNLPNVITTPHLGASTVEAQENVALDVAQQIGEFFGGAPVTSAVNMPSMKPEIVKLHQPYFTLAEKLGVLLDGIRDSSLESIEIVYEGTVAGMQTNVITRYLLMGMLKSHIPDSVNIVNAPILVKNRGVKITETVREFSSRYASLVTVTMTEAGCSHTAAATLMNGAESRIVQIDGFDIDLNPQGYVLVVRHTDKPGMIGKVGTLLGNKNINIGGMQVGRKKVRGDAVMGLMIDDEVTTEVIKKIEKIDGVVSVKLITF
jgi:D-3-phosphoglycerate dehydrogenase / 2-oxoglutarate reductase